MGVLHGWTGLPASDGVVTHALAGPVVSERQGFLTLSEARIVDEVVESGV